MTQNLLAQAPGRDAAPHDQQVVVAYTTDTVIRIDPRTGAVVGVIDLAGLLSPADVTAQTDVLNGIAYDAKTGRIFVTGKNWPKLFEIELIER